MTTAGAPKEEVGAYEHICEKRVNLATDETDIALDDEIIADEAVSLEVEKSSCPRLAWNRGRDDAAILVAHGPLYVHEKVTPLEFVKSLMNAPENEAQSDMFSTFNGLPEGAAFEPYSDRGNRTNRLIRAAPQRVTASLLKREGCVAKWAWCTWTRHTTSTSSRTCRGWWTNWP